MLMNAIQVDLLWTEVFDSGHFNELALCLSLDPSLKLRLMIIDESEIRSEINVTWRCILNQFIDQSSSLLKNPRVTYFFVIVMSLVIEDGGAVANGMCSNGWKYRVHS